MRNSGLYHPGTRPALHLAALGRLLLHVHGERGSQPHASKAQGAQCLEHGHRFDHRHSSPPPSTPCSIRSSVSRSDRFRSRWGRRAALSPFQLTVPRRGHGRSWVTAIRSAPSCTRPGAGRGKNPAGRFSYRCVRGHGGAFHSVFNTFANSTFWYLFNDVVPEELLARFMSWFRMIGLISTTIYNYFVFPICHESLSGDFNRNRAALSLRLWAHVLKVREGEYLPPPKNVGGPDRRPLRL